MSATKTEIPYVDIPGQYAEYREEILQAVEKVLAGGHYILGEEVDDFERRFATLCGVRHAIGVANGTDALILALKALDISSGDEVITAPNSFVASASSIALVGARPVFVDVRRDLNIDPSLIEQAITPRTRAILPVHLTGRCTSMDEILRIAKKHHLHVIEDAAQSVGATYKNKKTGSFGNIGCFSLHPLKNLNAVGDAGILTTNDDLLNEKLRLLRNHGLKNRNETSLWGFNSRLDTLQAAVLNCRLPHLKEITERRRDIAHRYSTALSRWVNCPQEAPGEYHTYHVYVIQASKRDELKKHLAAQGIDTRIHYPIPIHLQPCCSELGYKRGDFPVCEELAGKILSLPVYQSLTDEQVDTICKAIADFYQERN